MILFVDHVSRNTTATIGRPSSVFSESAFTIPTAYHEKTTPYGDFIDDEFDDTINAFEENDDDDFSEVIEAINPNVKVSYI
jgi:hypothetical protein